MIMKKILQIGLVVIALILGGLFNFNETKPSIAAGGPSIQGGDALWHLPKFGEAGWFIHAHNGSVRACNMDKASVIGDRQGPRCSNWE